MKNMGTSNFIRLYFGAALAFVLLCARTAPAYLAVNPCGDNPKCWVVDVLDRNGPTFDIVFSATRVTEAWNQMVPGQCSDVADVVVGGTFGENGAPGNPVPAGFAHHLKNRCTIVVRYSLESGGNDVNLYHESVEHGRKALAVALNRLDTLRTEAGKTSRLRAWGHSKGAAIVESTWRMEARNRNTMLITTIGGTSYYVNACPSNRCYYFGFGYPHGRETESYYSISRATASTWTNQNRS